MAIQVHLDALLKARGITAKELCKQVGITEANLSILRTGRGKGVRFATLNQCDVGELLSFDGNLDQEEAEEHA